MYRTQIIPGDSEQLQTNGLVTDLFLRLIIQTISANKHFLDKSTDPGILAEQMIKPLIRQLLYSEQFENHHFVPDPLLISKNFHYQ